MKAVKRSVVFRGWGREGWLGKHIGFLGRWNYSQFSSVQFSSVAQSCLTLCDPMNQSTPGLPVHHHLPEFTQTHVHRVRDAIQPSHHGSSPSPPAPNPSQHQSLFQWVYSLHEVSKVLELQTKVVDTSVNLSKSICTALSDISVISNIYY